MATKWWGGIKVLVAGPLKDHCFAASKKKTDPNPVSYSRMSDPGLFRLRPYPKLKKKNARLTI